MEEEIEMIEKNKSWELAYKPTYKEIIAIKWVQKTKLNSDSSIQKHKAKLMGKVYLQQFGIDYNETFFPVAFLDTFRAFIAVAVQNK